MRSLRVIAAMAAKDFAIARSYRLAFPLTVVSGFFGLIGFRFISKLVTTGQFSSGSASYFRYTVVGLVLSSMLVPAATAGSAALRGDQVQGTLEYLAAQPMSRLVIGFSWSAYPTLQAVVFGAVITATTFPLGFALGAVNAPVALAAFLLILITFLAVGNLGCAVVLAFQQGGQLIGAALAVLSLISGTLFPVSELPGWVQLISKLSPLTYALAALRSSLLADQPPTSYRLDLLLLAGFAVVLVPASAGALAAGFRYAQRRGTLSTF